MNDPEGFRIYFIERVCDNYYLRKTDFDKSSTLKIKDAVNTMVNNFLSRDSIEYYSGWNTKNDKITYIEGYSLPGYFPIDFDNDGILEPFQKGNLDKVVGIAYRLDNKVVFQNITATQKINDKKHRIIFGSNNFSLSKEKSLEIRNSIDAIFDNGILYFRSIRYCTGYLPNLKVYLEEADDKDVQAFVNHPKLMFINPELLNNPKSTIRHDVYNIQQSKVLDTHSASEIVDKAEKEGIHLDVEGESLVIPNNKKEAESIIGFLNNRVFMPPFKKETMISNSQRPLEKL